MSEFDAIKHYGGGLNQGAYPRNDLTSPKSQIFGNRRTNDFQSTQQITTDNSDTAEQQLEQQIMTLQAIIDEQNLTLEDFKNRSH